MDPFSRTFARWKQMTAPVLAILLLSQVTGSDGTQFASADPMAPLQPSAENVYDEIGTISQWYRYLDTPGHQEAEQYITSKYRELGLNTTVQEYTVQRQDGSKRGANVLGLLEGVDPTRCIVIGGHYDVHQYATSGAYDNGVGTASVIELAQVFTQEVEEPPSMSMVFAAWDAEEGGGAGSRHFLENPVWDCEVIYYINLDMYGLSYPVRNSLPLSTEEYFKLNLYTGPVSDFSRYNGIEFDDGTLDNFSMFRDLVENISYQEFDLPKEWVIVQDDTVGASDHRFYIERSIPAIWFRGMNEKPRDEGDLNEIAFKHTPADTLETMERYAGGKSELLQGISTGLDIAYSLVTQLMSQYNASRTDDSSHQNDEGGEGAVGGGAGSIALGLAVLLIASVVTYSLLKRRRGR